MLSYLLFYKQRSLIWQICSNSLLCIFPIKCRLTLLRKYCSSYFIHYILCLHFSSFFFFFFFLAFLYVISDQVNFKSPFSWTTLASSSNFPMMIHVVKVETCRQLKDADGIFQLVKRCHYKFCLGNRCQRQPSANHI